MIFTATRTAIAADFARRPTAAWHAMTGPHRAAPRAGSGCLSQGMTDDTLSGGHTVGPAGQLRHVKRAGPVGAPGPGGDGAP